MLKSFRFAFAFAFVALLSNCGLGIRPANAQSSGTIEGMVKDPTGGAIAGATVQIINPVSRYQRSTTTDAEGKFRFPNVPFNPYHVSVTASGFSDFSQDADVRSAVTLTLSINMKVAGANTTVTVESEGSDLVETESTPHTDVDRGLFDKMPLESPSSSVSSLVTLASPGVVADSNGLFHGLGDHAENSFSVDGQPITDQQSKVFSNQIPVDSIQSLEVISGAPPAEFGDKTSLVIKVTTRSGLGVKTPTGSVSASYGSFGTTTAAFDLAVGGDKWGNFISASGLQTSRFLDPPESEVMHDKGNQQNIFDRVDFQVSQADTIHFNAGYTRSWFQNPNSFDAQLHLCPSGLGFDCDATGTALVNPVNGDPLGPSDQRSQIKTFNLAPTWTHLFGSNTLLTFGVFGRRDHYNYYPSGNPFDDFSPLLQSETIAQDRTLGNLGFRSDVSYVKGHHNIKAGVTFQHTFLTEKDNLGIVDSTFIPSLTDGNGDPCFVAGVAIADPCSLLLPFDLTRGGTLFGFRGHTDIKEVGLYVQDTITAGDWSFNLGLRGDIYRGISQDSQVEPRLGVAYNIKPTNTVLRASYARVLETPFNENLIVGSLGDATGIFSSVLGQPGAIRSGQRNEFHAGFQQAFGKHLVIDGDYLWKYTHNAFDFGVLFNTPITFPIAWHNSKISGFSVRANVPDYHGLTAFVVLSGVNSRFFEPQVGGLGTDFTTAGVFRIDHDQKFQQTTHLQYQPKKAWPWVAFNWRYDNGLVAGAVPVADAGVPVDLTGLTADQQIQAGLVCGTQVPTLTSPLTSCDPSLYRSTRISLPARGTENDDHNPPRIAPRHLFDLSTGHDNLFHGDRYKWSLRFTVINLTNEVALYNFLSTFSGTHFVTPRTYTAELGFHF
ncbi:MAG TPA: TonB-dependent receptor [Candidatus Acidoferrum sp.]|nr:TonB-dependent receptor [Candidatus Acidoferrum sp.]